MPNPDSPFHRLVAMPSLPSKTSPSSGQAHTPGPWSYVRSEYCDGHKLTILDAWAQPVARTPKISTTNEPDDGPQALANARLIAAAPELLQALGSATVLLERMARADADTLVGLQRGTFHAAAVEARAALRSAT